MEKDELFWSMVEEDKRIVATWPQWMQDITITAQAAMTGHFIRGGTHDKG